MGKTFSESVEELSRTLAGEDPSGQEIDRSAIAYLKRTGTPQPSVDMITALADAVRERLDEESEPHGSACGCEDCADDAANAYQAGGWDE